jgi:PAS domain S-box-containing protein
MAEHAACSHEVIVDAALRLCAAGSAGISLLDAGDGEPRLHWPAVTGIAGKYVTGSAPAACVPCGLAVAQAKPILVADPGRSFPAIAAIRPAVTEALCVPVLVDERVAGTLWAMAHDQHKLFDLTDARILETLGYFVATLVLQARAQSARQIAEASQRTLDALMEHIPEGISIAAAPEVLITRVSRYGQDLTGRPVDRIAGIPAERHPEHWQIRYPDGRLVPPEELPLTRATRLGEVVRNEELVLRRGDGTDVTILCNAGPIRRSDGSVSGGVIAWRDIDDMKRVQAALGRSEEKFRTLAESLPAKVFVTDLAGRITYANRRLYKFTGAPPDSLLGDGWTAFVHPDDLPRVRMILQGSLQTGTPYEMEYRLLSAAGKYRWFMVRSNQVRDAAGDVTGWCGAAIDIDDARRAQAALRTASESKDVFLATLAHELRNPLAPIRNAARVLGSPAADDDATVWCRDVIGRQVAVMARLLDDLLDVSRITRGKLELRRERVSLAALLESAVETSRPLIDARGHELVVHLPDEAVQLTVDPVRITQVISNLLNNAAKFTPERGRIELSAAADPAGISIEVSDNGVGLSAHSLAGIFTMFSQVEERRDEAEGGLGIGLAIVKGLVEMHGGRVEARSAGPGRGSTFAVRLPSSPAVEAASTQAVTAAHRGTPRRILIVDDNPDIAASLALFLELEGHSVTVTDSGTEAVVLAQQIRPEIALLDVGMPGMDGYELARRLRASALDPRPVLIAVTGWGTEKDKDKAMAAGFDRHLTKPVDPDRLVELILDVAPR